MGFLETILSEKRAEVACKREALPLSELEEKAAGVAARDFRAAVARGGIIAELKARTPTIEGFVQSDSLDALARTYQQGGAVAISIVVDARHFGTSLDTVTRIRGIVDLPVLAKDFVLDEYQLVEARAAGADAVLLIARMLDAEALPRFLERAHALGISALVETHNEEEVRAAVDAGAEIIGINNRDLDRMETSLDTTRRLARLVPADRIVVAESGIHTRADVEDLAAYGATAFLIGGALLASHDPGALLRELNGSST